MLLLMPFMLDMMLSCIICIKLYDYIYVMMMLISQCMTTPLPVVVVPPTTPRMGWSLTESMTHPTPYVFTEPGTSTGAGQASGSAS